MRFAAVRARFGSRCAYTRSVVPRVECPSTRLMTPRSSSAVRSRVAQACRRSWKADRPDARPLDRLPERPRHDAVIERPAGGRREDEPVEPLDRLSRPLRPKRPARRAGPLTERSLSIRPLGLRLGRMRGVLPRRLGLPLGVGPSSGYRSVPRGSVQRSRRADRSRGEEAGHGRLGRRQESRGRGRRVP
jgi:hypothetical protein